jgi:hypothetical protein
MIILGLASFLLGVLLGRRFKVFVLVPASIAVGLGGMIEANVESTGFAMMLLMISSSVILLQLGYLVGLA